MSRADDPVNFLRALAADYRAKRDTRREDARMANAVAEAYHGLWLSLASEADRLEGLGKTTATESELWPRLYRALDLGGHHDLVWVGDGVWELSKEGVPVRVFTPEPYGDLPETLVPVLTGTYSKRAALLAILAVVEVTS